MPRKEVLRISRSVAAGAWLVIAGLLGAYAVREAGLADAARRAAGALPQDTYDRTVADRVVAGYAGPAEYGSIFALVLVVLAAALILRPTRWTVGASVVFALFAILYGAWLAMADDGWRSQAIALAVCAAISATAGLVAWLRTEALADDEPRPWHMPPPTHQN